MSVASKESTNKQKKDEEDILYFDFELRHHGLFFTEQSGGWIHRYS